MGGVLDIIDSLLFSAPAFLFVHELYTDYIAIMKPSSLAILGSTGSIGLNTLRVVDHNPQLFQVRALSAYNNFKLLESQIKKYKPAHVAVGEEGLAHFKKMGIKGVKFYPIEDCGQLASLTEVDVVVLAMSGVGAA